MSRLLESVIWFPELVEVGGVQFQTVEGRYDSRDVLAVGDTSGNNFREAWREFERRLLTALDAVCFEQLASVSAYTASTLVDRLDSQHVYLRRLQRFTLPSAGFLDAPQVDESRRVLEMLRSDPDLGDAMRFFRESMLSLSALNVAFHLLRAAESMAGSRTTSSTCSNPQCGRIELRCPTCNNPSKYPTTDKQALQMALGDACYEAFYVKKGGLRNRIMHGRKLDPEVVRSELPALRRGVANSLKTRLTLQYQAEWIDDPRALERLSLENYLLECSGPTPSLPELLRRLDNNELDFYSEPRLITSDEGNPLLESY